MIICQLSCNSACHQDIIWFTAAAYHLASKQIKCYDDKLIDLRNIFRFCPSKQIKCYDDKLIGMRNIFRFCHKFYHM